MLSLSTLLHHMTQNQTRRLVGQKNCGNFLRYGPQSEKSFYSVVVSFSFSFCICNVCRLGGVRNKPGAKWPRSGVVTTWMTAQASQSPPILLDDWNTGRNCASVGLALAVFAGHTILDPSVLAAPHGTCRALYRAGTAQATVFRCNTPWDVVRRATKF